MKLGIRKKLLLGCGLVGLLAIGQAVVGVATLQEVRSLSTRTFEGEVKAAALVHELMLYSAEVQQFLTDAA